MNIRFKTQFIHVAEGILEGCTGASPHTLPTFLTGLVLPSI